MSPESSLYRESALEQLSSPEQLDRLLRITSPKGWVSLLAVWALLGCVVVWAFFGTVYTREPARGIIVTAGGPQTVNARGDGMLLTIHEVGDEVKAGDIVATIDQPALENEIEATEKLLEQMTTEHQEMDKLDDQQRQMEKAVAEAEIRVLQGRLSSAQQSIERLRKQRDGMQSQIDKGFMAEASLYPIENELASLRDTLEDLNAQIEQIKAREQRAQSAMERDRRTREISRESLNRKLAMVLRPQLERESKVTSNHDGRIVEKRKARFDVVSIGEPLLLIEPREPKLQAILFVSAHTGSQVQVGDTVDLNPSTVKSEEHGSMIGKVTERAEVPTSKQAMLVELKDAHLVEQFAATGVQLKLTVDLVPDETTHTKFAWTSGDGPSDIQITAGTLCEGSVRVKTWRPIELVFPGLRRADDGT